MYSKNIDKKIAPASLTKIMTAVLLLDKYNIQDEITIKIQNNDIDGKIAYLKSNQTMRVGELLDFILVYSANDAAHAAALLVSETEEEFIVLMNQKANELGMINTNYMNVHGLDEDGHYTTLNDLLNLTLEAISYDEIIVSASKQFFYSDVNSEDSVKYFSTNELLNDNFSGLKTGWTKAAGLTFVGLYQSTERNIITMVSKSKTDTDKQNHFLDTLLLKDLSIQNFTNKSVLKSNTTLVKIFNGYGNKSIYSNLDIFVFGNIFINEEIILNRIEEYSLRYIYSEDSVYDFAIPKTPKISIQNVLFWLFR